jgi:hypothetical protein
LLLGYPRIIITALNPPCDKACSQASPAVTAKACYPQLLACTITIGLPGIRGAIPRNAVMFLICSYHQMPADASVVRIRERFAN